MDNTLPLTWNESKRQDTLRDRGLDFAHMVDFDWDTALTAADTRFDYPETRFVSVGFLKNDVVVCVWCYRDKTIRIISLRKANTRERKRYEQTPD